MRTLVINAIAALTLGGCAAGPGHIEAALRQISPLDAAVVAGAAALAAQADAGWTTTVAPRGERRYRISIARWPGHGSGEGEFNVRFAQEAHAILRKSASTVPLTGTAQEMIDHKDLP